MIFVKKRKFFSILLKVKKRPSVARHMRARQAEKKKLAKALLLLALVVVGQYTTTAGSISSNITNGHIITVVLDEKGKPQFNITSLAKLLSKYNATAPLNATFTCSCCNNTALIAANVTATVNIIANKTWTQGGKNYTFLFAGITATNGTVNYTAYVLTYAVVGSANGHYNFSAVTFILTKPNGEYAVFLTRIDSTPFKKNITAVEYVVIQNATTLADSYRIIADALKQVKEDSPRAWDIAHKELIHLANLVEKEIPQYNKKAPTVAIITDFDALCCLSAIGTLISCIMSNPLLLRLCPLCAMLIPCISACINIFTIWTCLACIGTALGGCVSCALGVAMCVNAALQVYYCCLT
ncbi:hypothetical protein CGL51_07795 [Pyrobaculum aerophilum]|uniref:Uncharacterized protein n=1 Tax=Pyrobaculum aerophilum TaxID=13773 RepID=A0A371QXQ8_9CREN|nr:hypothetical protein CGL51_07795 [Pyrobaculum aerophilum]